VVGIRIPIDLIVFLSLFSALLAKHRVHQLRYPWKTFTRKEKPGLKYMVKLEREPWNDGLDVQEAKMRDPKRIPILMAHIQAFWEKYPDQRFHQMMDLLQRMVRFLEKSDDLFQLEDDKMLAIMNEINAQTLRKE
jgi:hypothetical protein